MGKKKAKRTQKLPPKEPHCSHQEVGFCQECITRIRAYSRKLKNAKNRQRDRSLERYMLVGKGKMQPLAQTRGFVERVKNMGYSG